MINATLCSTSREEPWAANVDFEVQGATWTTTLSTAYAHYQNVVVNESVVVVYKTQGFEMIAKGSARLDEPADDGTALATIALHWLRLVEDGEVNDHTDAADIERIVNSHL